MLSNAYETLYESSNKYILVAEYYNRTPVSIKYRDHNDRLFKRDFAGEILDKYPDLTLVDYGFVYHRDNNFPKDDLSWFLLEKKF
jgi:pseudaminic acid biosynthesis-associated methylase